MLLPNDNMEQTSELQRLINGCVAMEYSVASMYSTFMHLFLKDRVFWKDLFDDEMDHAFQLKAAADVKSIDLSSAMNPLPSIKSIENSIEYAEHKRRQIKAVPVSLKYALKIALHLEELLLNIYSNKLVEKVLAAEHEPLSKKIASFEMLHINKILDMITKNDSLNSS